MFSWKGTSTAPNEPNLKVSWKTVPDGSKSGEDTNTNISAQTKANGRDVVISISDHSVEKEIKTISLTDNNNEDNKPCCSWQCDSLSVDMSGIFQPDHAAVNEPSSAADVLECDNHVCESDLNTVTHNDKNQPETASSLSISGLFDDLQSVSEPTNNTAPPIRQINAEEFSSLTQREIYPANFCISSMFQLIHTREPVMGPPPSYSKSLLDRRINPCASIQFVAPIPPPSYDGMENELRYVNYSGFTLGLGNTWQFQSQPAYCPVCETVTITRTDVRVSSLAHIIALIMFFLLCWPFCLLPYFLNVCNYTFHYCSICHTYLGVRRPFQRNQ